MFLFLFRTSSDGRTRPFLAYRLDALGLGTFLRRSVSLVRSSSLAEHTVRVWATVLFIESEARSLEEFLDLKSL